MTRISWERFAVLAGFAFVVFWFGAFGLGIEVGASDREILDHYADSGNRAKEAVAFFLIAAAALAFVLFAGALRSLIRVPARPQHTAVVRGRRASAPREWHAGGDPARRRRLARRLRHGLLPRWLGWAGFPAAALLPLAISFVGFLVLALWVIAVSAALAFRRSSARAAPTGATP